MQVKWFLLIFLLASCTFVNASSEYWTYSDPARVSIFNVGFIEIQTSPRKHISIGHRSYPAESCKNKNYLCIESKELRFAVPRDFSEDIPSWEVNGGLYKNLGKRKLKLFGNTFDTFYIEHKMENNDYIFIYSKTNGLLGIVGKGKIYTGIRLLEEGHCGYGAEVGCK